jgi:hypothetical protein
MSEIEIKKANFDELMRRFQDCTSAETAWAMGVLKTPNCADVTTLVNRRMSHVGFNDDFKTTVCTPPKSSIFSDIKEQQFVQETESMLNLANWMAFVSEIRRWVNKPPQQAVAAVAAVAAQTVDPLVMRENWNRIRNKLLSCGKEAQKLATELNLDAFGGCSRLLIIINYRGDAFPHSLFVEPFDDAAETRFVDEVNRVNTVGLTLDPAKWIKFIEFLRYSIRSLYQQPVASDADQDASRALEASVGPTNARKMPKVSNVYGHMHSPPQLSELLHDVVVNIFAHGGGVPGDSDYAQQCNWIIGQVLDKLPSLTQEQLNEIHGDEEMPMMLVDGLKLTYKEVYPQGNVDAAFDYACMAYFVSDPSVREQVENYFITIPPELNVFVKQFNTFEQQDVYHMWKRFFMIAQLMHSWTQIAPYDRTGVYADASRHLGSKSMQGGKSKRYKRSNSKRSKRSDSKRSNSKRSKRSNSKRSNSKRNNSKRSNCRSRR